MLDCSAYHNLLVEKKEDGILLVTMNQPEKANAMSRHMYNNLCRLWQDVKKDPEVKVAIVTGAGRYFSPGGDFELMEHSNTDIEDAIDEARDVGELVYSIINLDKPIISAINGDAMGAGLSMALCADISIASKRARLSDGHMRAGVVAGDHACIIWPLLCGMAKTKYYVFTADWIDASEAERIGLVSMVVPHEQLLPTAFAVAQKLARGPQQAMRLTKKALNQWLRFFGVLSFDYSAAAEILSFLGEDPRAAIRSLRETRRPPERFPSAG